MMPRKKLDYYAGRHGIEHFASVRLTDDQVARICEEAGSKKVSAADCGGRLSPLIDIITDDPTFADKVKATIDVKSVSDDFFSIRLADYAADAVMAAYAKIIK